MSWFRGKKEPEPEPERSFADDTTPFEGSTNFASGPPSRGAPGGGGGGAAGMAELQVQNSRRCCTLHTWSVGRHRSSSSSREYCLHLSGAAPQQYSTGTSAPLLVSSGSPRRTQTAPGKSPGGSPCCSSSGEVLRQEQQRSVCRLLTST